MFFIHRSSTVAHDLDTLKRRGLDPQVGIDEVLLSDEEVSYVDPSPEILKKAEKVIAQFKDSFDLQKVGRLERFTASDCLMCFNLWVS